MPPKIIKDFRPHDVIGIVIIIGCFFLIWSGTATGWVYTVLLIVVGFFFGRKSGDDPGDTDNKGKQ